MRRQKHHTKHSSWGMPIEIATLFVVEDGESLQRSLVRLRVLLTQGLTPEKIITRIGITTRTIKLHGGL